MRAESPSMNDPGEAFITDNYIQAVSSKAGVIWVHSLGVLTEAGAVQSARRALSERLDPASAPVGPNELADQIVTELPPVTWAAMVGLHFLETSDPPEEPWPAPYFAAFQLIYIWQFWKAARRARRRMIQGAGVAFDCAELVWLGMHIGSLSEGARPEYFELLKELQPLRDLARARVKGGRIRGAKRTADADLWRVPTLARAIAMRSKKPWLGQKALVKRIEADDPENADGRPDFERVTQQIAAWEKSGDLERSTRNPQGERS